jgi:hypothetical protein
MEVSKPGKHGTLHLYAIEYGDVTGVGEAPTYVSTLRTWAYDIDHALEKFYDADDGFKALKIARVPKSGLMHRANWTKLCRTYGE